MKGEGQIENLMKTLTPAAGPTGTSDMKLKICQSQVQALIEQEVRKAVANKEWELQSVIQELQDTHNESSFETSIQKLESRVDAVSRRAEVALAYMAKFRNRQSPERVPVEAMSQSKKKNCEAKKGALVELMENTRNALKRFRAHNEGLTTALADLDQEEPPPVLTPWGSPNEKEIRGSICSSNEDLSERKPPPDLIPFDSSEAVVGSESVTKVASQLPVEKREPTDLPEDDLGDELKHIDEQTTKRLKKEHCSAGHGSSPKLKEVEGIELMKDVEDMFFCPPLPKIPFPSVLKMEAALYSMPQIVEVKLAFIKNPTRISVLWNVVDEDPCAPPMESYTIFLTMETYKGSGVFLKWDTYDKLEAKSLPMCASLTNSSEGTGYVLLWWAKMYLADMDPLVKLPLPSYLTNIH